jgi:O-antigen ligase
MNSILHKPIEVPRLWELLFLSIGAYLLFHPALADPRSYAVALGGGLALFLVKPQIQDRQDILGKTWWLFLLYTLLTSFWSLQPGITLRSAGFLFLGTFLFLAVRQSGTSTHRLLEGMGLTLALAAACVALYQRLYGFNDLAMVLPQLSGEFLKQATAAAHNKRAFGPLTTPGAMAALMVFFIPQAWIKAMGKKGPGRLWDLGLAATLLSALWTTQSAGAWASLLLAAMIVLWIRRSGWAMGATLVMGAVVLFKVVMGRGLQSWLLAAFSMRIGLWHSAWELFLKHPWLGTGLGTFGELYQGSGLDLDTGARYTHNLVLQVMVETGGVGLILLLTALVSLLRRFKAQSRWEAWGVGTGLLAVLLFSLVDLPFQMPELVWLFAAITGRLEIEPEKGIVKPDLPLKWVEWGLLGIFLVTGFWPPFRPWNFCLLAVPLWVALGYFQPKLDRLPVWMAGGGIYLAGRAFFSPSASGTVRFLEIFGLLISFYLILPHLSEPKKFLRRFFFLGLAWAVVVWWMSFHYAGDSLYSWIHFQYSDVKDMTFFVNPKQVGIVLGALVLLLLPKPWTRIKTLAAGLSLLTVARLKSFSGAAVMLLGLVTRLYYQLKSRYRLPVIACLVFLILLGLIVVRSFDPSPTKYERFGFWESALKVWCMEPILGVGPGAFAGYYHLVKEPRTEGVNRYLMDAEYAHNEYLDFLAAFGLLGLLFLALLAYKTWKGMKDIDQKSAASGLAAAAFVDFCLHTPLIALQGVGLVAAGEKDKTQTSWIGAFLALGLALGLFGSAAFAPLLKEKHEQLVADNKLPEALETIETAERLNAWDAQYAWTKADYLDKLYFATKDPTWEQRSDEALDRSLKLEQTDGERKLEKAERLTNRLSLDQDPKAVEIVEAAWAEAKTALPLNAFVFFEEGLYNLKMGKQKGALWDTVTRAYGLKAFEDFRSATLLEPNFAAAWMELGLCRQGLGEVNAKVDFRNAWDVYERWKDVERIDPLEKQLVSLNPQAVEFVKKASIP